MREIVVFLLGLLSLMSETQAMSACLDGPTKEEQEACAKMASDEVEIELNKAYRQLMSKWSAPDTSELPYTKVRDTLRQAQRSWVIYREADCQALYLLNEHTSFSNIVYLTCMTKRARTRIEELTALSTH